MDNIVITGATGFIGIHLIERLLRDDVTIYAIVRPDSPHINRLPQKENIRIIYLNIEQITLLNDYIHEDIDCFYHLCWNGTRKPLRDDIAAQQKNYHISLEAMYTALRLNTKAFIAAGSQAEYGNISGVISEETACHPDTEYGIFKKKTFETLSEIASTNKIKFIWGRIFSAYGEYDYDSSLIMYAIDCFMKNKTLKLSACSQQWDYIYVKDVADVLALFRKTECSNGSYNIAYGESQTLKNFIEIIKREFPDTESLILFGEIPSNNKGLLEIQPSVSKLKAALNWRPATKFADGIRKIIELKKQEDKNENNQHINSDL